MLIVDAQVHIWAANTPERPWAVLNPPYKPHRPVPFSKDDLLREMDVAGVHRVVLVPPPLEGRRNDLVLEAARLHPDRFAVMGLLDIDVPEARSQLATWRLQPGMLGLRLNFKTQGNLTDEWLWSEAEAVRVPIMLGVPSAKLDIVGEVAKRHPGLKLAIVNLAIPQGKKDDEAFAHISQLLALAKYSNIAVNATSLPFCTSDSYPYRRLQPYIHRVYDAFGPKRMFWGTDLTRLACTYRQAITMFTEELPWLTSEDKEWIMGRALCEWIGWKLP